MQKPKSVIYGVRVLYASTIALAVFFGLILFNNDAGQPVSDMFFLLGLPVILYFYFIYLLSKGRFWVRSVLLGITIIGGIKLILSFGNGAAFLGLLILCLEVIALRFLYSKESNVWYAEQLASDTQKSLEKRKAGI
jgi:hypothetical protein